MMQRAATVFAAAVVLAIGGQDAEPVKAQGVEMQALLVKDGSGLLFVNNGEESTWSWQACSSDLVTCRPFGQGREISTVGAEPSTVFRVSGAGKTGRSPLWHGNLSVLSPPTVRGPLRANELVTPVPATWGGGWEGDFDQTQLSVCARPAGGPCSSITEPKNPEACPREAAVLDPAFAGGYLRIADRRFGPGAIFTLEALFPYGQALWRSDGQTAVAFVGRIQPATGPRAARCGPPPLRLASISKLGVAEIRCPLGCRAELIGRRAGRVARFGRLAPARSPFGRPVALRLPVRLRRQLGEGQTRMSVEVDGRRVARRTVFLAADSPQRR
ncbi:MAG TPA: hypothetical protein VFU04_07185 [Solirubrobacterales bacterium]|nr:hypothetical protein [Solirubrobacterales bacterium]